VRSRYARRADGAPSVGPECSDAHRVRWSRCVALMSVRPGAAADWAARASGIIESVEHLDRDQTVITRVMHAGGPAPKGWQEASLTPEARMEAAWELTLLCMAWGTEPQGEPRLQRSVVRIQRSRR